MPEARKTQHLEPGAGHYGIFAGKSWRLNIRPMVLDFIDENSGLQPEVGRKKRLRAGGDANRIGASDHPLVRSGKIAV